MAFKVKLFEVFDGEKITSEELATRCDMDQVLLGTSASTEEHPQERCCLLPLAFQERTAYVLSPAHSVRIMRALVSMGIFSEAENEVYCHTALSKALTRRPLRALVMGM